IHGFHAPTLEVQQTGPTEELLKTLGFELVGEEESPRRLSVNSKSTSAQVDLVERAEGQFGVNSAGTVHHIAFRCANDKEQSRCAKTWSTLVCTSPRLSTAFIFIRSIFASPVVFCLRLRPKVPDLPSTNRSNSWVKVGNYHPSTSNIGPKLSMRFRRF